MKGLICAIARALRAATSLTGGVLDAIGELALTPLRLAQSLFGGGGGGSRLAPEFDPGVSALDMLEKVAGPTYEQQQARRISQLDRDGIQTVAAYASALPAARRSFDLSGLKKDLRTTLLAMSDEQLDALSRAKLHEARRFVSGEEHGIPGVPVVGAALKPASSATPSVEELRDRVRAALAAKRGGSAPFVMPKLPRA